MIKEYLSRNISPFTKEATNQSFESIAIALAERHPLFSHKGFDFGMQETYKDFKFGARIGPSVNWANTLHDQAHLVEFGADNFGQRAPFGFLMFDLNEIEIAGELHPEPQTNQPSLREIRTNAIEARLFEACGVKFDVEAFGRESIRILGKYMPDCAHTKGKEDSMLGIFLHTYECWPMDSAMNELKRCLDASLEFNPRLNGQSNPLKP